LPASISEVPSLAKYVEALGSLGYTTVDHVQGAGLAAGDRLAAFLDISPAELARILAALPVPPRGPAAARPERTFRLGARLDRVPRLRASPPQSTRYATRVR
jgi:hypothetical protein